MKCHKHIIDEAMHSLLTAAFDDYIATFFERLTSKRKAEKLFKAFYRYQLAQYLYTKDVYMLSVPEGDMISDLILDTYVSFMEDIKSSPFRISREGMINLLSEIEIIFPSRFDTEMIDSMNVVSK